MTISEYQLMASKTIVDLGKDSSIKHLENAAIGLCCESSEVLQTLQRFLFCGKDLDKDHLVEECGDVLWYLSYILTVSGVKLEDCMKRNLEKISDRYPYRDTMDELSNFIKEGFHS